MRLAFFCSRKSPLAEAAPPVAMGSQGVYSQLAQERRRFDDMTQISERLLVQAHLDAKQPKPLTA
ncbi:hypothetical protein, partial [Pseudomonas sp. UBA6323]|uniref:hypothetical protein n=1 Tax=Pseudomonas sp. UBA6323 TaxID=1947329 RepID=UPI0025D72680